MTPDNMLVVIPGDLAHSWAGLPVMMPRNTESGSSNTGVETRSSVSRTEGKVVEQQLTVPCSVQLVKLRQSSKKLVLKNGSGYYNLTREESASYRIEGIKVLRTINRSMPTATKKRGRKMNRPDPRDPGFHHYSQSRESGFLNTSPGDYHKQGRYDGRYSGPYRSRGRDDRFEQRRHWSRRTDFGNRVNRDSYGRDNNNSRDHYDRRASSYPNDSSRGRRMVSPEGRYDSRSPEGDCDVSSGFQERVGRYPDHHPQTKSRQVGSSVQETPKSLSSTYRKSDTNHVPSKHTITQNATEKEDSTQSKDPKENKRTTQNHTLNKDNTDSPVTSQGLSNSVLGKTSLTVKTNTEKHKKKSVLTMSQQMELLNSKRPKANVEINEIPAKQSVEDDAIMATSGTGNGASTTGSPHRTEVSVPNHIHDDKETSKATAANSSGESDSVAASPRRVHSARKSAPTSNVSRTQKSVMLKKQALLRSQSSQDPPASTASSSPTARMCSGETTPVQRDSDTESPSIAPAGKDGSESTSNDTREAFTPPLAEDMLVLSDTMETGSQDNGNTEESTGQTRTPQSRSDTKTSGELQAAPSVPDSKVDDVVSMESSSPKMISQESEVKKSPKPEEEDQEPAADEGAGTTETPTPETSEEPERNPDVGKMKEKALLKLKENLKKNLLKGKISPQTSSPGSRLESRSSSNDSPEILMDTTEGTSLINETHTKKKEASNASSALSDNVKANSPQSSGTPDAVPEVNEENIGKASKPCTEDDKVAKSVAIDVMEDNIVNSQSDKPQGSDREMQASHDSNEPVADRANHICNNLSEDSTSATKKSACVNSPDASAEACKTASSLPNQSDEASKKFDPSMPEVGDSLGSPMDDLSEGSVDLGPHEPGDMDSIDDDLLLEDEPIITSEDYNPEPEEMDISHVPESLEPEVSELAIARVESQSEDVQVDPNQPSTSKRALSADVEDIIEEPVCKKSRTDDTDIIADLEGPEPVETADVTEADAKEVIFTQSEWKEFALSIKEKYERLVQTFNQKTNVMYEAQARWQQETLTWKKNYQELEEKYERLAVQVNEGPAVEKQSVEVQTIFTHRTKLSRKKKEATRPPALENKAPQEEAMETEQGETCSSDAPISSGSPPPQTTSDCEPSAASSSRPNSSPIPESTQPASNKSSNLESKRQVFKATLNKVMLSKKNLSGGSDSASGSDLPSGKTSPQVGATTPHIPTSSPRPESLEESSKEQPSTSNGAAPAADAIVQESTQAIAVDSPNEDSPMDTSETECKTSDTLSGTGSPTILAASMSTQGPNLAITASGTTTAASQQDTGTSKPTPSKSETSNLPSHSEVISSQSIPSPSKSPTSTAVAVPTASQSKAQSEPSEKTKEPSATDSSKLPGSPKKLAGTASKEASKDSVKKSSAETDKEASDSKSVKPVQAQAEPEVIDLTDDPDPPTVNMSKSSAPSPHKQKDALPGNKHTTLTTRSPHSLSPAGSSVSAVVSGGNNASASGANARQVQTGAPNVVLQNASQRSVQRTAAVQPEAHIRTGSKTGPVQSPKRNSPGVPQSDSPQANKQSSTYGASSSAVNIQLRNLNPPVVTTQMQSSNVRPQVVSLQHGPRQQIPPAGRGNPQVTVSQGLMQQQQRQMPSSQHTTTATVSGLQPVMATMQNQARMQGQAAIQQRLQQQQQQISLKMLQQSRQGVHQLPGAAASAAALATRQPQTWIQQNRPQLQVTSTQQQSLQVCQQIQLPTGQIQLQMVRPHGATGIQTLTSSTGQQIVLQKPQQQQQQQQQQPPPPYQVSIQEQIQAQERAHAANQTQARAKAAREQQEQAQHQQARIAAERLQSSQLDQQQAQRVQIKKLREDRSAIQTTIQQHQNKKRLLLTQIQREDEMQRTLMNKLSLKQSGMSRHVYKSGQKQLQELKEQERKLRGELSLVDKTIEECVQKSNQIDQRLCQATNATAMRLSPQEIQKQQLQQQQQQLNVQLVQRQFQQQRTQQLQQQQQVQLQQKKQVTESAKTKHPAQLPDMNTVLDVGRSTIFTPMPIKPSLEIKHSQEGIVLSWKADPDAGASKIDVKRYLLYAYQESESSTPSTDLWKKIGAVDALPLPMACTLTHFKAGSMYHFAVCAISKHGRPGAFSNIGSINLP